MLSFFAITAACAACRYGARAIAADVATLIAGSVLNATRRAHRALVATGSDRHGLPASWARRPSRRERRLLRTSLRATIRCTAFTSLLPEVMAQAHHAER